MRVINAVVNFFYEIILGCRHEKLTRPFTIEQQTYKVCLDCGRQVYYSADAMRPLRASEVRRMKLAESGGTKVLPNVVPLTAKAREAARSKSAAA